MLPAPGPATAPRPAADRFMRRLLGVGDGGRRGSAAAAQSIFGASIAVSAVRCLLTYVVLPLLAPVVNLSGGVGPILGLAIGAVSMAAIVVSMRRFWAADHRLRWGYTAIGGAVLLFLSVQAVIDVDALVT